MSGDSAKVFVYGSLRTHMPNHHLLSSSKIIARQSWVHGKLYDTGFGYPAAVLTTTGKAGRDPSKVKCVYGELYEVSLHVLCQLDDLEGYREESDHNDYDRIRGHVFTDAGSHEAYVYVYPKKNAEGLARIPSGDWKCHLYLARPKRLYFAYGSCMDDQRFHRDGVAHLFRNMVGRGVLTGFSLRFTHRSYDGGRADIVEIGGRVEGKVYRVNREAMAYLYWREGVYTDVYRPTFVDLAVNGKSVGDVLTFVVKHKEQEMAPPPWYAEELLRGGRGFLSDEYLTKLQKEWQVKFGLSDIARSVKRPFDEDDHS